jgi:hypothetical protein
MDSMTVKKLEEIRKTLAEELTADDIPHDLMMDVSFAIALNGDAECTISVHSWKKNHKGKKIAAYHAKAPAFGGAFTKAVAEMHHGMKGRVEKGAD